MAAIAQGIRIRPWRLLVAYLEREDEKRCIQAYKADMLWAINKAIRKEWEYPLLREILEKEDDKEAQKKQDEEDRRKVYEWLMGGEG